MIREIGRLGMKQGEKEDLAKDIIYIKESYGKWVSADHANFNGALFLPFFGFPLLALISLYVFQERRNRLRRDSVYASRVAAYRYARRGSKSLRRALASGDQKIFYETLFKAIQNYLGAKLRLPSAGLTFDAVDKALISKDIDPAILGKIKNIFDACDATRFAFTQVDNFRMKDDIKEFEEIVNYFERKRI